MTPSFFITSDLAPSFEIIVFLLQELLEPSSARHPLARPADFGTHLL